MRPYSCWCPACIKVTDAGPRAETHLTSDRKVDGCAKASDPLYEWRNASFRAKTDRRALPRGSTGTRSRRRCSSLASGCWLKPTALSMTR
jgi:hypothetical protein